MSQATLNYRWLVLTGLTYSLVLLGLATLRREFLALAFPFALYWLAGLVLRPDAPRIQASRRLSIGRAVQGTPVTVRLALVNPGEQPALIEVEDQVPTGAEVVEGLPRQVMTLAPGAGAELIYGVRPRHGVYPFDAVRVTAREPLGLSARAVTLSAPAELTVLPLAVRLPRLPVRPRHTGVYAGLIPTRQGGSGLAFFGVREYQPGDALRRINWRASARHADATALFSNDFQQERSTEIGLILDARQRSLAVTGADEFFEHAVTAVASLAQGFLHDGNRVGLLLYGRPLADWTFPGYGQGQRERLWQALTRAQIARQHLFDRLEYLPTRFFMPDSQIVFVSPLLKEDLRILVRLRARGYAVLVISPDPVAFEMRQLASWGSAVPQAARIARLERRLLLAELQQAGVPVLDWDVATGFDEAARSFVRRMGARWER